eukprot:ANDGO_03821.mRNA.1 hypothetical protein
MSHSEIITDSSSSASSASVAVPSSAPLASPTVHSRTSFSFRHPTFSSFRYAPSYEYQSHAVTMQHPYLSDRHHHLHHHHHHNLSHGFGSHSVHNGHVQQAQHLSHPSLPPTHHHHSHHHGPAQQHVIHASSHHSSHPHHMLVMGKVASAEAGNGFLANSTFFHQSAPVASPLAAASSGSTAYNVDRTPSNSLSTSPGSFHSRFSSKEIAPTLSVPGQPRHQHHYQQQPQQLQEAQQRLFPASAAEIETHAAELAADATAIGEKERRRVTQACVQCKKIHRSCDSGTPCTRCSERGIAHECSYGDRRKRGRKTSPQATNTPTSVGASDASSLGIANARADGKCSLLDSRRDASSNSGSEEGDLLTESPAAAPVAMSVPSSQCSNQVTPRSLIVKPTPVHASAVSSQSSSPTMAPFNQYLPTKLGHPLSFPSAPVKHCSSMQSGNAVNMMPLPFAKRQRTESNSSCSAVESIVQDCVADLFFPILDVRSKSCNDEQDHAKGLEAKVLALLQRACRLPSSLRPEQRAKLNSDPIITLVPSTAAVKLVSGALVHCDSPSSWHPQSPPFHGQIISGSTSSANVMDSMPVPFCVFDGHGNIVSHNSAFIESFGQCNGDSQSVARSAVRLEDHPSTNHAMSPGCPTMRSPSESASSDGSNCSGCSSPTMLPAQAPLSLSASSLRNSHVMTCMDHASSVLFAHAVADALLGVKTGKNPEETIHEGLFGHVDFKMKVRAGGCDWFCACRALRGADGLLLWSSAVFSPL